MADFYTPAPTKKEGYEKIKWQSITGTERDVEVDSIGRVWNGWKLFCVGKTAFTTPEEAIAKAKELRIKKINSLKKQIEKLESFG